MSQKQININCKCFKGEDLCTHPSAPACFLGKPQCILVHPRYDIRIPRGCTLQIKYEKPAPSPKCP